MIQQIFLSLTFVENFESKNYKSIHLSFRNDPEFSRKHMCSHFAALEDTHSNESAECITQKTGFSLDFRGASNFHRRRDKEGEFLEFRSSLSLSLSNYSCFYSTNAISFPFSLHQLLLFALFLPSFLPSFPRSFVSVKDLIRRTS